MKHRLSKHLAPSSTGMGETPGELSAPPQAGGGAAVLRWLIYDTFRQAIHSYSFALALAVSGVCILFCLSLRIDQPVPLMEPHDIGIAEARGQISIGFGAFRMALFRDGPQAVHFLQALLAKWVAGTAGLLLALIWTAGLVPSFLEPGSSAVLMAKPNPRWLLLLGKYLGVVGFVAFHALVFVLGTWAAIGCRTGIWETGYLAAMPLLLAHFAVVFGFSLLLAVSTRSPAACVFGSILFWLLCYGLNYGRHLMVALPQLDANAATPAPAFQFLVEAGYWLFPKPADFNLLLDNVLQAGKHFPGLAEFHLMQQAGEFHPRASVASSLGFAAALFLISARQLARTDY